MLKKKKSGYWNSLVVQWLGLQAFTSEGPGSVTGRGTKILQATWPKKLKLKLKNKINKIKKSGYIHMYN